MNSESTNVHVIRGIHAIVNPDAIKPGMSVKELERLLTSNGLIKQPPTSQDRFASELAYQADRLNIPGLNNTFKKDEDLLQKYRDTLGEAPSLGSTADDHGGSSFGPGLSSTGSMSTSSSSSSSSSSSVSTASSSSTRSGYSSSYQDDYDSYDPPASSVFGESSSYSGSGYSGSSYSGSGSSSSFGSSSSYPGEQDAYEYQEGSDLYDRTREEQQRKQINAVNAGYGLSEDIDLEDEYKEDQKIQMLEQIDALREDLELSGTSIKNIKAVDVNSSYEDISNTLRILLTRSDRIRYCTLAEEGIIWGACALEDLFNGKNTYFGYRPDLTGWHHSVIMKLRRNRNETSQIVSSAMKESQIGPVWRLGLELLINMTLYSRTRKDQYAQPGISQDGVSEAYSRIRDNTDTKK